MERANVGENADRAASATVAGVAVGQFFVVLAATELYRILRPPAIPA